MSRLIYVVDTSYLLELFKVPGHSQHSEHIRNLFSDATESESTFYVPQPCIYELANHIAQVANGHSRLKLANSLYSSVLEWIEADTLWNITPSKGIESLPAYFKSFVDDFVTQKVGLTDTFVIFEAKRLKYEVYKNVVVNVHIWTKDKKLKSREPDKEENPFLG